MDPDPDPAKAVTDAVKEHNKQTGTTMTPERRAQLAAMFNRPPVPAGPVAVTRADVAAAVGGPRTRVGNSRFELAASGGTINLYVIGGHDERVGHITGPVTQEGYGLVQTVKVVDALQGMGLGKLLATAYYEFAVLHGATHVGLDTPDTSGGFWLRQGIAMGARVPVATAQGIAGNQNFTIG